MKTLRIVETAVAAALMSMAPLAAPGADEPTVYKNDFEKAALDQMPEGFLALQGEFVVKEEAGNKFLELPGAPLESFGVLFGPTEPAGLSVGARIHGTGKGRRFPTFGIGLNGGGGYKLQVSPGKKLLELYRGEEVLASVPFSWESGSWVLLRLQTRLVKEGQVQVAGKAWKQGDAEPKDWQIKHSDSVDTPAGRPSLWGMPYAGTPIRFDDLQVSKALEK